MGEHGVERLVPEVFVVSKERATIRMSTTHKSK